MFGVDNRGGGSRMKQYNYDGDREIDLGQLILLLWKKAVKIILAGLITAALLVGLKAVTTISAVNGNGTYIGTSKIYIANDVPSATADAIHAYFTSNDLLNNAIKDLNLNLSVPELISMINLGNSTKTLITLNVTGTDRELVQRVTDYLTSHGIEQIINGFKYKSAIIVDPAYTSASTGIGWVNFIKRMVKYCALGFLLGIAAAAGVYAFLFIHDNSIRDERDIHYYLGVPVLGIIPAVHVAHKIDVQPFLNIDNKSSEEVKKLRTNVTFLDASVIDITSVAGGEGKSMISFWLAKSLSEIGKKVVLINANIRKDDTVNTSNINNIKEKGLSDYLVDSASMKDITCESNYDNLHFILSGRASKNPAELLSTFKFKELVNFCRNNYNYVIVDTPAAGEVTDAAIIAAYMDGNILVVEPGIADGYLARKVKVQLESSGSKLLGVVINKA